MIVTSLLNRIADKALVDLQVIRDRIEADPCPSEIDVIRARQMLERVRDLQDTYDRLEALCG